MDCARSIAALRDFICGRFFSEQSVVAAVMVHDWSRRWVDCISRFAPESDGRADDLLATGGSLCQPNVFCNVLLSRECRSLLESGLAINCRSCSTRLHHAMSSCHARNVDQRFCSYRRRGSGQYVAHGPVDRAFVGHCDLLAIWASASAKAFAHQKKCDPRRRDRDSFGYVRARVGKPSRATAQPLANPESERAKRCPLAGFTRRDQRAA